MNVRDFDKTPLMEKALLEAHKSLAVSGVPVGTVLVSPAGQIVSQEHNTLASPLKHAEIIAIEASFKKIATCKTDSETTSEANHRARISSLAGFTLVTTLEPCIMCAGAILNAQIDTVIFGAWDEKFGAAGSVWDLLRDPRAPYHPEVFGGVLAEECADLLQNFFKNLRNHT